ncbi:hypothetical protein BEP19_04425 [Ammoniphilus oxalaticus]|uniref:DUF1641 domain-containing protein n=1 Tax=Ammoniphilus oxalaticus TaxID=66863 RepID=A0A419SLW0_9BACL|nr:DUF1641 domain-containing protein [Ammoniphilus oxalaticus]RKD25073.1 hypothetical protein BEP19_04425 [Ammoniphilus oxalaticus]
MAKAIRNIEREQIDPAEAQSQDIQEVLGAVAESKDALIVFLDILKEAHEAGLLDILQGVLKTREEVSMLALQQLNQQSVYHSVKNVTSLARFIGQIEPEQLSRILNGVAHGLQKTTSDPTDEGKPSGLWGLTKNLRDSDVNSTLYTALEFMKGMGEGLRKGPPSVH